MNDTTTPWNAWPDILKLWRQWWALGLLIVGLLIPVLATNPYVVHVSALFLLYVILAVGLSIVLSYAGLLAVGYVAFFAIGAYVYATLNVSWKVPFLIGLPLGALAGAAAGLALGLPTLRARGDYLAIVTLAFLEIINQVLRNWSAVTGGAKGITGLDGPQAFGFHATVPWHYYYLVLLVAVLVVAFHIRVGKSALARVWEAIRDDETASEASGLNATRWLLVAFIIGAFLAGIAGVLFASIQRFVSPESFALSDSILILSIVVLAGGRSVPRIFLATAVLFGLPELLRGLAQYRMLCFGALLVGFTTADEVFGQKRKGAHDSIKDDQSDPCEAVFPESLRPMRASAAEIRVAGLAKSFSGLQALRDVNLKIACQGRIVGLVGTNGAGKTTLFNCISGLVRPDRGSISITGIGEITGMSAFRRAQSGLGRTFQQVKLFKTMTVQQNVQIGAINGRFRSVFHGLATGRMPAQVQVNAALKYLGLAGLADVDVLALPIGIQRKVEIARALAQRASLLLLDEPASGLNEAEKQSLVPLLKGIASAGISVLLVEHDIAFVRAVASHVIVMEEGNIITEGTPDSIFNDPRVLESYLGLEAGTSAARA